MAVRRDEEITGRDIEIRGAHRFAVRHEREQIAALALDDRALGRRPRREDAHHFSFDEAFGNRRIFDLIAKRDAKSMLDQLGDIAVGGVIRHAAHRRLVLLPLAARGEDEIENRRGFLGILEKHLVKVAEAVEEDGVGDLPLDVEVLLEHRRELHRA